MALKYMAAKPHPHEGATYQILEMPDGTFGVEVSIPDVGPTKITGLVDRASAEAWVARHQEQIAAGPSPRKPFVRRRPR